MLSVNVTVLGSEGVGKSTFIEGYSQRDLKNSKGEIFSVSVQFTEIGKMSTDDFVLSRIRSADGCLLLFSLDNLRSMCHVPVWNNYHRTYQPGAAVVMIGTHSDLNSSAIQPFHKEKLMESSQNQYDYVEISRSSPEPILLLLRKLLDDNSLQFN